MPEQSPLSYQTTMPEYPDTSYDAYKRFLGLDKYNSPWGNGMKFNRAGVSAFAWSNGLPDYAAWQATTQNEYNSRLSAYNTWLSTGAGQRASAESGGYNPSYFNTNPSASPVDFQQAPESPGWSEMAQGVSGIFQFAQNLAGLKMITEQIAGQKLKNEAQSITNKYLDSKLMWQNEMLGFNLDRKQYYLEDLFYPRWSAHPELWKRGAFSPYGRGTYNLQGVDQGLTYQRAVADLDFLKAGKTLRDAQSALQNASSKEKNWYIDNVLEIQKDILTHTRDILKGEYDFQKTEQQLRKAGVIAGIGVNVINAAVNAIKAFIPGSGLLAGKGVPSSPQSPYRYPDWMNGDGTGLDLSQFGSL